MLAACEYDVNISSYSSYTLAGFHEFPLVSTYFKNVTNLQFPLQEVLLN